MDCSISIVHWTLLIPYVLGLLDGFTMEGQELCYSSLGPHSYLLCLETDLLKQCLSIFLAPESNWITTTECVTEIRMNTWFLY